MASDVPLPRNWTPDGPASERASLVRHVKDTRQPTRLGVCKTVSATNSSASPLQYMRALRELSVLLAVPEHPNIVRLLDSSVSPEWIHTVMEAAPGQDLAVYMKTHDEFMVGESQSRKVVFALLQALEWLHSRGVVHRDVKADNIVVSNLASADSSIMLIDFGFASFVPAAATPPTFDEDLRPGPGWNSLITLDFVNSRTPLTAEQLFYIDLWGCAAIAFTSITGAWAFGANNDTEASAKLARNMLTKMGSDKERWRKYFGGIPITDEGLDFIFSVFGAALTGNYPTARQLLSHPWFESLDSTPLNRSATHPWHVSNAAAIIVPDSLCVRGSIKTDYPRLTGELEKYLQTSGIPPMGAAIIDGLDALAIKPLRKLSVSISGKMTGMFRAPSHGSFHSRTSSQSSEMENPTSPVSGGLLNVFRAGSRGKSSGDLLSPRSLSPIREGSRDLARSSSLNVPGPKEKSGDLGRSKTIGGFLGIGRKKSGEV